MTATLERALAPLMVIGSFCNLGMFEYPLGRPMPYFSYLYALAKWSFLMYYVYYPVFIYYVQKHGIFYFPVSYPWITITLIVIGLYRFKVKISKCTPGLYIIIYLIF
ncbi:hypothetical protein ALC60_11268 [Trachymyrmex zeteki]|uniref:Uncharacterized protein n=1 Tax=Mycetomoellerius zeteki TaxID=64791 RepID=A0A151WPE7_9HYME|nr:hypothetical protein ALC60_11268 [Trachymyrmex zeteki]